MKFKATHGFLIGAVIVILVSLSQMFKTNDNGYRTVVQWPNGYTFVQMEPGFYTAMFGKTTKYTDLMEYDLGGVTSQSEKDAGTIHGISVRYQDGGTGTVDGVVRVALPQDPEAMLALHRAFRSEAGVRETLLIPEIRQALNLTAGLMTSEEAYAERRNDYANWATDQIQNGRYATRLITKEIEGIDGSTQEKRVPVQRLDDNGEFMHQSSPLTDYNLRVTGFQVTEWDFEPRTLDQISAKREAEMEAIKLEAQARRAQSEQAQIIAQGTAEVERVRYEQLQVKEKALIEAQREKEVAVIQAEQKKEANAELLLAAEIDVQTAAEEKEAAQLRADGEAYAKRVIMEADGALQLKADAAVAIHAGYADALAKRQVPEFFIAGGAGSGDGTGTVNDVDIFRSIIEAGVARDLMLDLNATK